MNAATPPTWYWGPMWTNGMKYFNSLGLLFFLMTLSSDSLSAATRVSS